jgi:hypothetical protein
MAYGNSNKNKTYPNSGAMFARQKKSDSASDFGGDFTLDDDVLDYVVSCAERGQPVKLEISAWKRRTQDGGSFLSLALQTPYETRGGQRQQQGRGGYGGGQQRGGYSGGQQRGGRPQFRDDPPPRREEPPQQRNYRDDSQSPRRPAPRQDDRRGFLPEDDIPFGNDSSNGGFKEPWDD